MTINLSTKIEHSKLEMFNQVIPIIHAMIPDVGIGISNTTEWLSYYPGTKINLGVEAGSKIDPEEPLADCIKNNKFIKEEVPAEFFGFSFTGLAKPILDGNDVIGAIAIQIQEQNEKELKRISDQIFQSLSQANDRIKTITTGADDLAEITDTLLIQSNQATEGMDNTDEVILFIKKIANQTNILGLNASIEAARAGDKGRGFDVVAKEIRKLSTETVASTDKISHTLTEMKASINQIQELVNKIVSVSRTQAASTKEVSSSIDEIEEMSNQLKQYAKEL
ncbi:methyl-accepting chemotaxis protein [Gracilibacillus massiliensis]|uniref:methyl-accepting chemotaxis protein n=1 Tax=Gracilibacillus massiliensis TaxID=1564956 RepID=UPI00071E4DE6|nr:methyl-accepting chemotaxis protein [Gracilibacillus massiliensis]